MKTSFISNYSLSGTLRNAVAKARDSLADATKESTTLRHADIGLTLGGSTGKTVGLRDQYDRLNGIVDTNGLVASRLEVTQKALDGMRETAEQFLATLISVRDGDKKKAVQLARMLAGKGFRVFATHGTAALIQKAGIACEGVNKVKEGRPHCVDMIKNGDIQFVANTTEGKKSIEESRSIRAAAIQHKVCYFTTIAGALAAATAMDYLDKLEVNKLQALHASL